MRKLKIFPVDRRKELRFVKFYCRKPDILILDEPTNHLDNKMSDWLENYLEKFSWCSVNGNARPVFP